MTYPETLEIIPLTEPPNATVRVPGSKSITNRALVLAALASCHEPCDLHGILHSEDTEVMIQSLQRLGFVVEPLPGDATGLHLASSNRQRLIPAHKADLFIANSGTTMRFLTAMVNLGQGTYRLDGVSRMRERPMADLLRALNQLGGWTLSEDGTDFPPVVVEANGLEGGTVRIKGDVSSQFLSGLLMAAALAHGKVVIEVDGPLVSQPYVHMTVAMMRDFGATVETTESSRFVVPGCQAYHRRRYHVEPDASAASYFFAAAAVTGGCLTVAGLGAGSLQGDVRFVNLLEEMGCQVERSPLGITVTGGPLHGIDADMNDISDTVMTLAAVALFAEGPTTIRSVAHIRHKETDRLAALATELRRLGAEVDEFADGLTITPRPLHGATVKTYNDHRLAMSLALVGLRIPGVVIDNPACVAKT